MSSAAIVNPGLTLERVEAPVRLPLRNLLLTFALTVSSLAIAGYAGGKTGYEMLIVMMGWPHVILGFLFYFGKVLRGERLARSSFVLLGLLTLALWAAHYSYTITGFISIYFTYHVFRDEVFIYHQTRARHRLRDAVKVAGFIPFILLMFIVTDPRPQHYRQDLRRAEVAASEVATHGWTLFRFDPISYSEGRDFYFYVEARRAAAAEGSYTTFASVRELRPDGEIRISDRVWQRAADLIFLPHYGDEKEAVRPSVDSVSETMPMSLAGAYRLGQTFRAERGNLAGIWLPTRAGETGAQANTASQANLVVHLTPDTSVPLPPLSPLMEALRYLCIIILVGLVLRKVLPVFKQHSAFWMYFAILIAIFAVLQKAITAVGLRGLDVPVMFQLVVVFHYWSWYVFSFDKLNAMANAAPETRKPTVPQSAPAGFDRLLAALRSPKKFLLLTIGLNLAAAAGVLWYSKWNGPASLRYVFDYSYFLYFLVFHVTFSFGPKQASQKRDAPAQPASVAAAA